MPRKVRDKIGLILLKYLPTRNTWRASYRDQNGKYVRRYLWTADYGEAVKIAQQMNSALLGLGGYLPAEKQTHHTVKQAFEESIKHTGGDTRTKKDYINAGDMFLSWLAQAYPGIRAWSDLRPVHAKDYLLHCQREGLAHDTIRKRLYVLRMTDRYMSENYPDRFRMVTHGLRLKRSSKGEIHFLTQEELAGYLAFAEEHYPDIYPVVMLQGLAGLRVLEAANLRDRDVDFVRSTVRITTTSRHKPKNLSSDREIPIPSCVLEAIRRAMTRRDNIPRKVFPIENFVFTHSRGEPWGMDGICKKIKRSLKRYSERIAVPRVADLRAHELRASFVTMMRSFGVDERVLKCYIGHTLGDIMGKHYEAMPLHRLETEVVAVLESKIGRKNERLLHHDCSRRQVAFVNALVSEVSQ